MPNIKELEVRVTYTVGIGGIEAPKEVVDQLRKAAETYKSIDMDEFGEYEAASQWLQHNIRERDSMEWSVEIEDIV